MNTTAKKFIIDEEYANSIAESSPYFHWFKHFEEMPITEIAQSFYDIFNERLSTIENILSANPEIKGIHLLLYYITDGGLIQYWATKELNRYQKWEGHYVYENETFELTIANSLEFKIGYSSSFRFGGAFFDLISTEDLIWDDYDKICRYIEKLGHVGLEIGLDMFIKTRKLPKGFAFFLQDIDFPEAELLYLVE